MYENLPIFKKALELNVYVETIVKNFDKYNKYHIGSELREKSRQILYAIYKIYMYKDKQNRVENLVEKVEELKITIYLAKELKSLKSFKQFEVLSTMAYELAKQSTGWLKSQSQKSKR
jgi:hypothetical protein